MAVQEGYFTGLGNQGTTNVWQGNNYLTSVTLDDTQAVGDWALGKNGGNAGILTLAKAFINCTALTSIPATIPVTTTTLDSMLLGCTAFNSNITAWNTSNVTSFAHTFSGCANFNQEIGTWSASNYTDSVRDFSFMLSGCTSFNPTTSYLDDFVTSTAVNLSGMLFNCSAYTGSFSGWDVSNVTTMANMMNG